MNGALRAITNWWKSINEEAARKLSEAPPAESVGEYLFEPEYETKLIPQIPGETVKVQRDPNQVAQERIQKVLDIAMMPEAGMLKEVGITNFFKDVLKGWARERSSYEMMGRTLRAPSGLSDILTGLRKIPQKEYKPLLDIKPMLGVEADAGRYSPETRTLLLNPYRAGKTVVPHEFTHARTWNPQRTVEAEEASAELIREARKRLYAPEYKRYKAGEITSDELRSMQNFIYRLFDPAEKFARDMGKAIGTTTEYPKLDPRRYDQLYSRYMGKTVDTLMGDFAVARGGQALKELLHDLGIRVAPRKKSMASLFGLKRPSNISQLISSLGNP